MLRCLKFATQEIVWKQSLRSWWVNLAEQGWVKLLGKLIPEGGFMERAEAGMEGVQGRKGREMVLCGRFSGFSCGGIDRKFADYDVFGE